MPATVEWGFLLWLVSLLLGVAGGAGTAVLWGVRLFAERDREIARVERAAEAGDKLVTAAELKARKDLEKDMLLRIEGIHALVQTHGAELSAFKLKAGETYATRDGVNKAIERLELRMEKQLGDISRQVAEGFNAVTERFDRLALDRPRKE